MQVLPQLRKLEERYPDELAIVGIHTAKFPAEKERENLRNAVMRYDIRHPVVNDRDFTIWQRYAVRAWPTLYLINPAGMVLGKHEGEFAFEDFDRAIGGLVTEYDRLGLLHRRAERWPLEREQEAAGRSIAFPSKVLADGAGGRLFIADSGHHRIVVATLEGELLDVVGRGSPGLADGDYADSAFHNPQGLSLEGDALYIADTENHAVRRVDLAARRVETVAGTGEASVRLLESGEGRSIALRSPWDVEAVNGIVYIAMAGTHQIWSLDLSTGVLRPFAGTGVEGLKDDSLARSWLAQPSGLATDGAVLFFADSETSSVRAAALDPDGVVTTFVGSGLFDFGDRDGTGDDVLLQHPLGVAYHDGLVYIADAYNNKVKRLFPATREVRTLYGDGEPGLRDGSGPDARLAEPGGLSVASGRLFVADTNNHAVRVADLDGGPLRTLEVRGLEPPAGG